MKADYDTEANAIAITLRELRADESAARSDHVHDRCTVALIDHEPVDIEVLYPELGIEEPLAAAAARHNLDLQALRAAARSALEAPDRVVTLEVALRG